MLYCLTTNIKLNRKLNKEAFKNTIKRLTSINYFIIYKCIQSLAQTCNLNDAVSSLIKSRLTGNKG